MTAFLIDNMAPIMFAALVIFLLLGYPVAFSLAFVGLAFGALGIYIGLFSSNLLQALPDRVFGIMANETLLAIPFFTFMGLILERSGMAEDLLDTAGKLFGPIRGGVAYAVIFVGALLAATTGVVAASVIAMGLISLPIMLRYGYDRRMASGVIAASGTLAQIIPPSLVLIILADQLGRSVGDMYKGAIIPGLVLTALYMIYVFLMTMIFPKAAPALPAEARSFGEGAEYRPVIVAVTFPLVLVIWGMIVLFAPKLGIDLINAFVPGVSEAIEARFQGEGPRMLAMLGAFALAYLVYVAALRYLPKILSTMLGALFLLLAVGALWKAAQAFHAGFLALPPASERGLEFLLDLIAWIAGEWVYFVALLGLIGGGVSLLNAPSQPVAAAVWKIIADLLPPLGLDLPRARHDLHGRCNADRRRRHGRGRRAAFWRSCGAGSTST